MGWKSLFMGGTRFRVRWQLLFAVALCLTAQASARNIYVAKCGDDGNSGRQVDCGSRNGPMVTIQTAILAARDGDTVLVFPGTYVEAIRFYGQNVTVRSTDGPDVTVVDGQNVLGPLVSLDERNGPGTLLDGFTLTRGNTATDGGGLYIWQGSPQVTNCRFVFNQAHRGGGVFVVQSQAAFSQCLFSDNRAGNGGGAVYAWADEATWDGCTFQDNTADDAGGALFVRSSGTAVVRDCRFDRNESASGGAVANIINATANFARCTFDGNRASLIGGAILTDGGASTFAVDCIFTSNTGPSGGAIIQNAGTRLTATDCLFRENLANEGGGLFLRGAGAAVTRCTFVRNFALYDARTGGGAIYNAGDQTDIFNSVFIGNTAITGGAIINFDASPMIQCSTFYANEARSGGGAGLSTWGTGALRIHNSILWANADPMGTSLEAQIEAQLPEAIELFHSLVQGGGTEFGNVNTDPRFVDPVGPDGTIGTGDEDLRLQHGSPAVDAGANGNVPHDLADVDGDGDTAELLPLDSADSPRLVDVPTTPDTGLGIPPIVDIGAYELQPCGDPDADGDGLCDQFDQCPDTPPGELINGAGCSCGQLDDDGDGVNHCDDACPNDPDKIDPGQCGCGFADTDTDGDLVADCVDPCPADNPNDTDGDGSCDSDEACPDDPDKTEPGQCGCGNPDTDGDGDGVADCVDPCPVDNPDDTDGDGICESDDGCPDDPGKTEPGVCGCGTPDTDSDGDGVANCRDDCPADPGKTDPGVCGCGIADVDTDGDGVLNCIDPCPYDNPDDSDLDGVCDFDDGCPHDPLKLAPGLCGCGVRDTDSDLDGVPDCNDPCPFDNPDDSDADGVCNSDEECPDDPDKTEPGQCGCGIADTDGDGDGVADCNDPCPDDNPDDSDGDGACDSDDGCPADPEKTEPGQCGCGQPDSDADSDGVADCIDPCPLDDPDDTDGDNVCDSDDGCPVDPDKTEAGLCGCGVADDDTDSDTVPDCLDLCPETVIDVLVDTDGCRRPADFNGNGCVESRDYAAFVACLGGPGNVPPAADIELCLAVFDGDGSGAVDLHDYAELAIAFSNAPEVVFVDLLATGPGHDGLSWCTAFVTLHEAVASLSCGTVVIRVANGVYTPESAGLGDPRQATFHLPDHVAIRGGYAGCGAADPHARDLVEYETVLSGDLSGDDQGPLTDLSRGENTFHVVTGTASRAAVLDGFTIAGGNANGEGVAQNGAGLYAGPGESLAVIDCRFTGNYAAYLGGGMYNESRKDLTVQGCVFSDNEAAAGGGAYNNGGEQRFEDCLFMRNAVSIRGGGMYNTGGEPIVRDCVFRENLAEVEGGGVRNYYSHPMVVGCTFEDNLAVEGGGGMANLLSDVTVTDSLFQGNTGAWSGGLLNENGSTRVTNCQFRNNEARSYGAGALGHMTYDYEDELIVIDSHFSGNISAYEGGATAGDITAINCTFFENVAQSSGGAMAYPRLVVNCQFIGNSAQQNGGAIFAFSYSSVTSVNSVFSGNTAGKHGGAIFAAYYSQLEASNCTFSGNVAGFNGGGVYSDWNDPVILMNSILWGNSDSTGFTSAAQLSPNWNGWVADTVNHSVIQGGWGGPGGVGILDLDPRFVDPGGTDGIVGTLDDNLRLLPGSPAIDAGDNTALPEDTFDLDNDGDLLESLPLDLDGRLRRMDDPATPDTGFGLSPFVDLGAYEFPP